MFVYLSKKVALPSEAHQIRSISWNKQEGYIAVGCEDGLLKVIKLEPPTVVSQNQPPRSDLTMNQTCEGHRSPISSVIWNEMHCKLTSSDSEGLIIVWTLHRNQWVEEMINNRNKSPVSDMKWSSDGTKICIGYEDGSVIVGSVEGNRVWGKDLSHKVKNLEWAPDGRTLLFATEEGRTYVYDGSGNQLCELKLKCGNRSTLAAIQWFNGAGYKSFAVDEFSNPSLCFAFENGVMQLMRNENDENPVVIDTGMAIKYLSWNHIGSILAVAGSHPQKGAVVQFYTNLGIHMRTLGVPDAQAVTAVSWEGNGLRIALSVNSILYFANIKPDYKWAFFNETIVYSFMKPDRADYCIVFWNTRTDDRYVKYVKKLMGVAGGGECCVLATKAEESNNRFVLILCNAIGSPIDTKQINIEPLFISMNKTHVIVCSEESIYVWQYRSQVSRLMSLDSSKRKIGREIAFNVDEQPDLNSIYDVERFSKPSRKAQDPISCVTSGNGFFMVGRASGTVNKYTIPHVALETRYMLNCRPQLVTANCDNTKLSIIDINGVLSFYDTAAKSEVPGMQGAHTGLERKDVWDMKWAQDHPDLIVVMEKTRMYVMMGNEVEDPVVSSGYLCDFKDLEIKAVLLDEVMKFPDSPGSAEELILYFETKSLRDTREMVQKVDIKDAYSAVEQLPFKKLWSIIAEAALKKLDFEVAHKAFVKYDDYQGICFVNKVKKLDDIQKQKAEVAIYFKNFDEAEDIYKQIDRKDLALDMRVLIGDWVRVIQLVDQGVGTDELVNVAYDNIANYYSEKFRWQKAASHYSLAQNNEALVKAYYQMEDYENLSKMIEILPEQSPLLQELGEKLESVGLCEEAVKAYVKAGNVRAAVDCCVVLNQWNLAIELAEEHNFVQIEGLLSRYANMLLEENKTIEAIQLYRKANRNTEAAKILNNIAKDLGKTHSSPIMMKKLYVMAALEVDSYKKRVLEAQITGTGMTAKTLDSLITSDINTMSDKTLDNPWRGAEAYHFFLLAQRQLYEGDYESALKTCLRLSEYENVLETRDIYSLIALAAFYAGYLKECSRALVKLENLPGQSDEDREKYEELAVSIFSKYPPRDPKHTYFKCPGKSCPNKVSSIVTNCNECGSNFPACMASGQPILEKNYVQCKTCKHKAVESELHRLRVKNCPLCHAPMQLR